MDAERIEGLPLKDTLPTKPVSAPVAAVNPARFSRDMPFAGENSPPAKTVPLPTASARTWPSVDGAKFGSSVPSGNTCARSVRGTPPTDLKSPPRYQPPPHRGPRR